MTAPAQHDDVTHSGAVCVDLPNRPEVMKALAGAKDRQRQAEIEQVALVATAADAYGWVEPTPETLYQEDVGQAPSVLHGERLVQMGGDGTPLVAEFITHEVGPALRMSPDAARKLIADVLNLRHRLPQVWKSVLAGRCEVWVGRKIAGITRELVLEWHGGEEEDVPMERLPEITEAFLTSTGRDVQPVLHIDDQEVSAEPGPITLKAMAVFAERSAADVDP